MAENRLERLARPAYILFLGLLIACAAVAGVLVSGALSPASAEPARQVASITPAGEPALEYGGYATNLSGETYGSIADELAVGTPPDLVLVEADGGLTGYVRYEDLAALDGPAPASPAEAAQQGDEQVDFGSIGLPMYEADGVTRIGTWYGFNGTADQDSK